MYLDIVDLRAFYADRLGQIVKRLIGEKLKRRWPSVAGDRVLGIGYATPYLAQFAGEADCRGRLHAGGAGRRELAGRGTECRRAGR